MPIMYVCEPCYENAPEQCGHHDRTEVRVMPNGSWICEYCFDECASDFEVQPLNEDGDMPCFRDFAPAPEHKSVST